MGRLLLIAALLCSVAAYGLDDRSVLEYGAIGDGKTDCTAAFQKAMDEAAASGGGRVRVPAGMFLIASRLRIPPAVTLEGIWEAPPVAIPRTSGSHPDALAGQSKTALLAGSVLLAIADKGNENAAPFIRMETTATLKGLIIHYPEQVASSTPAAYPWTVQGSGDNITILDCLFINPYMAVDFGANPCGRHLIRNLYAQAIYKGLFIDKCYDVGRVENVHFWPFWMHIDGEGQDELRRWTSEHGTAFILSRSDWEYISNSFCISYKVGIHFKSSAPDGPGNYLLSQSGADGCDTAVMVEETQGHSGVSFSNAQIFGRIVVGEKNHGPVRFTSCGIFGATGTRTPPYGEVIRIEGHGRVSFDNCHFYAIDGKSATPAFIRQLGGRLSVTDSVYIVNKFLDPIPLVIEKGARTTIYCLNEHYTTKRPINRLGKTGRVIIKDNIYADTR